MSLRRMVGRDVPIAPPNFPPREQLKRRDRDIAPYLLARA